MCAVHCIFGWGQCNVYIFGCIALHIWMGAVECIYLIALHCIFVLGHCNAHVWLHCIYSVTDAVQRLFGSSAMHIFGCKRCAVQCAVHICFCFKTASVEYLVCGESASNWVRPVGVW